MTAEDIRAAAESVAEQVAASMRGLTERLSSESVTAFALVVADDFATVCKAVDTEARHRASGGGPAARWQPAEWLDSGMELDVDVLLERLGDPTFQVDPELERERPARQAAWLAALVEGLRLARAAGHLDAGGSPVFAFCTVQDSGLAAWCALESARLANAPEIWERVGREFAEGWAGWESDAEAVAVRTAYEAIRGSLSRGSVVEIEGWNPGFQKVACTKTLQAMAGLGLAAAKHVTDAVMEGRVQRVPLPSDDAARRLAEALRQLGASARVVADDGP